MPQPRHTPPLPLRLGVAALLLITATAGAQAFGGRRDLRTRLQQAADDALSAGKATPAQRAQVQPAISEVLRTAEDAFGSDPASIPELDDLLRLFAAEPLDTHAVTTIRTRRDRRHKALADKLVEAYVAIHAALAPEQRERVVVWSRKKNLGKRMKAFKERVISSLVNSVIEEVLGQIAASESERKSVHDARDRIVAALTLARTERQPQIDELHALFRMPTLDRAALDRVRVAQEQQVLALTVLVEETFSQLHGALAPARRQRLVELIHDKQAHRPSAQSGGDSPF